MRNARALAAITSVALVALLAPSGQVAARPKARSTEGRIGHDRLIGVDDSAIIKAHAAKLAQLRARAIRHNTRVAGGGGYSVGDKLYWPAWDDTSDFPPYLKKYKLRGVSRHMELWVAAGRSKISGVTSVGTAYPEGDCRNDYRDRIRVTNAQVDYFIDQFETNMYPTETALFSTPPPRNGENADATLIVEKPKKYDIGRNYWKGKGRRIVTLVDNVRDDQFYDTDDSQDLSRIAGFFSGYLNDTTDRNVMTIDSWNWKYSTTGTPPSNPVPGNVCESATADPYGYEGTFAHEFEHLLEYYADEDGETSWIDEGLAEYAAYATGYLAPAAPMTDSRWHGGIQCFLGNVHQQTDFNPNPHEDCGPENSLTWWGDQVEDNEFEILADYGAAFMFQLMLAEEYGEDAITFLHNDEADGLEGLQALLDHEGATGVTARDKIHQWALMVLLDGLIDDGATVTGGAAADYQVDALNNFMDLSREDAYAWPGSPPNGSDYVRARAADGTPFTADQIESITFAGDKEFPADEMEWTMDANGDAAGGSALAATDTGSEFDGSIARTVTVPAGNPTLTFDTKYDTEEQWDFLFVQVSDDGGDTWTSLSNDNTRSDFADGAYPTVQANVPGLTGTSGGGEPGSPTWVTETFDLSDYAGQEVVLSFRYVTDWAFEGLGVWLDNVAVGGTEVSAGDDLADWKTQTQVNADDVEGNFSVRLVSFDAEHTSINIADLPLDADFAGSLSGAALDALIGTSPNNTVVVLVMFDEATEEVLRYAPYTLSVNSVVQPGGR